MRPLTLSLVVVLLAAAAVESDGPVEYRLDAVHRKLVHHTGDAEVRLAAGAVLPGGASLSTGWWSWAELEAPAFAARFRVGSRTRLRLAGDTPGILLELERGRLRALFDALASSDPPVERTVRTPSALLAVRGTEYGVEVDRGGDTTLVVFHGTVEVRDPQRAGTPVWVSAGHQLRVGKGELPGSPRPHSISPDQWDRGRNPRTGGSEGRPGPGGPGSQQSAAAGGQPQSPRRGKGGGRR
jgi:hypothetical protein